MSKRNLLNLILLGIVAVLVLVVVYEPGVEKKTKTPLATIDKSTINKITIERTGQEQVTLEKQDGNWVMQAPFHIRANKIKTESLLALVELETFAHYPLKDLDVKNYGLDIPRASITFNDKERFDFGGTEPLNKRRYVRYRDTLYVMNDYFYYQLMSPITVFVDHKLLPESDNITKLVLPALTLTLHDGTWQLQPKTDGQSNEQANELIENWKLSHAMQISDYDGKSAQQSAEVYLDNKDTPITFHILLDKEHFYLARPDLGLQYEIARDKVNELLKLPSKIDIPTAEEQPAQPAPKPRD
jgi:hypothetical protein